MFIKFKRVLQQNKWGNVMQAGKYHEWLTEQVRPFTSRLCNTCGCSLSVLWRLSKCNSHSALIHIGCLHGGGKDLAGLLSFNCQVISLIGETFLCSPWIYTSLLSLTPYSFAQTLQALTRDFCRQSFSARLQGAGMRHHCLCSHLSGQMHIMKFQSTHKVLAKRRLEYNKSSE